MLSLGVGENSVVCFGKLMSDIRLDGNGAIPGEKILPFDNGQRRFSGQRLSTGCESL